MPISGDGAQRASDLSALIVTACAIAVMVLVRPLQWTEPHSSAPSAQPVQLSLEEPSDVTPAAPPPLPLPRLTSHELVTRAPVPQVPDPVPLTDGQIPEDAAVVATSNLSPPKVTAPAARNADLEAQYAEGLREDIDRRTHLPDSPQYRLHRVFGEVRVRFVVARSGEARQVQVARSSGSAVLDQAAISIVASGHYAPMPQALFGTDPEHTFAVTIDFSAAARAAQAH